MSGIVGLAYDTISVNGYKTWLDNVDLKEKSFSFYLNNNPEESYMVIPGWDDSKPHKNVATHKVV